MKFYIASRVWKKRQVEELQQKLQLNGHSITFDWKEQRSIEKPWRDENSESIQKLINEEIAGIQTADVFVLLGDEDKGIGMHVEFGIALQMNELRGTPKIYVVTSAKDHCIFYHHPAIHFVESIEDLLVELKKEGLG